jgi:hypothetical protein
MFYGTRRFITTFTRALHWSLSYARSIQLIPPHHMTVRSVLILSSHLCSGIPSGLYLSRFPTRILYAFLFSPMRATCSSRLILYDLITLIVLGEESKLWSSPLCSFLQPPVTSSLFGPNILPNALFSKHPQSMFQVLHPCRTTGKIIVCMFSFLCF